MKKFRYLLSIFAIALVVAGTSKAIQASADTEISAVAPLSAEGVEITVDYEKEWLQIKDIANTVKVYYQAVKSADVASVKANAWLPAACISSELTSLYRIDISVFTKNGYIALTTDQNATKAPDFIVKTISSPVKSLKVTLDFTTDYPKNLYDALAYAEVTNADASIKAVYNLDSTDSEKKDRLEDFLAVYTLEWKRGTNGLWKKAEQTLPTTIDEEFLGAYKMLRSSNGTLYVRVYEALTGTGEGAEKQAVLRSKEVKVKVPKTATAPTIKINYLTGTFSLKNGQEFLYRYGDKDVTFYIPTYDKAVGAECTKRLSTTLTKTSTKVTSLTVDEIIGIINENCDAENRVKAGDTVTIECRTTATAKKYASRYATITFKNRADAPAPKAGEHFAFNVNNDEKTITVDFTNIDATENKILQYAVSGVDANPTTLVWTELAEPTKAVDLSSFYGREISYKTVAKEAKTVNYELASVYYRYAPVADKTVPENSIFASAFRIIGFDEEENNEQNEPAEQNDPVEQNDPAEQNDPVEQNDSVEQNEQVDLTFISDMDIAIVLITPIQEVLTAEQLAVGAKRTFDKNTTVKYRIEDNPERLQNLDSEELFLIEEDVQTVIADSNKIIVRYSISGDIGIETEDGGAILD